LLPSMTPRAAAAAKASAAFFYTFWSSIAADM
jgi:hypothetical protein